MTTEQIEQPTTALTLPQRAAVALGTAEHEKKLILLVEESKTIVEIKNTDGRTQCHAAYMRLKNSRVAIDKNADAATEDAKSFTKAIKTEKERLIALMSAEEDRLQAIRDKWDADREAEKLAKIEAEKRRVARIQASLDGMRDYSNSAANVCKTAESIQGLIDAFSAIEVTKEFFEEYFDQAVALKASTITAMEASLDARTEQEAEAARLISEREELARLRQEAEARKAEDERKATEARAAQEAELAEARRKQESELAAQRAEAARQQAERDAEAARQARAAKEAQDAAQALIAAEQERLRMERAAFEREQAEIAEAKRLQEEAEAERIAEIARAEEAEAERIRLQAAHNQMLADAKATPVPAVWPFPVGVKPAPQPDRILTLVITIKDAETAKWIWGSHAVGETSYGVEVDAIYEGDALTEIDRLREELADVPI